MACFSDPGAGSHVWRVAARRPVGPLLAVLVLLLLAPRAAAAQEERVLQPTHNWAGYVASDAYYSGVSALIQVPQPGPSPHPGAAASWVGIGGTTSPDLIQAGVDEVTDGRLVAYHAWYETLPQVSRTIAMDIRPGDWVRVDIHELDSDLWQITIVNGQQVFQLEVPYASSHSSAEWIVEKPSLASGQLVPLAGLADANFAEMVAIANEQPAPPAQLPLDGTAIVAPDGLPRAIPSPLGPDGASFGVGSIE